MLSREENAVMMRTMKDRLDAEELERTRGAVKAPVEKAGDAADRAAASAGGGGGNDDDNYGNDDNFE